MQQDKKKNIDGIHIGDKEIELYLLAEDMAIYVENLRKSVKIFLEAVSDYIKDAWYKVNTYPSTAFLYTSNEQLFLRSIKRDKYKRNKCQANKICTRSKERKL